MCPGRGLEGVAESSPAEDQPNWEPRMHCLPRKSRHAGPPKSPDRGGSPHSLNKPRGTNVAGTEAGSASRGLQGFGTGSYPRKNAFQGLACPEPGRFPDSTLRRESPPPAQSPRGAGPRSWSSRWPVSSPAPGEGGAQRLSRGGSPPASLPSPHSSHRAPNVGNDTGSPRWPRGGSMGGASSKL